MASIALFLVIQFSFLHAIETDFNLLTKLRQSNKITSSEYAIFYKQLDFRTHVMFSQRRDSLARLGLDIVYTEEAYFPHKDSFVLKEYYFSSQKCKMIDSQKVVFPPDMYFENGQSRKRYFFDGQNGRDQLNAIRQYMLSKQLVDNIDPLVKIEIVHAGCGMAWKTMEDAEKKARRAHRKKRKPDYYLIETFLEKDQYKVSFQRPVKTNYKVIVEGHSF